MFCCVVARGVYVCCADKALTSSSGGCAARAAGEVHDRQDSHEGKEQEKLRQENGTILKMNTYFYFM